MRYTGVAEVTVARSLVLAAVLLAGCPKGGETDPDTDTNTGDTDADCPVVDCADPLCADVFECTWPTAMTQTSNFTFTGATVQCPVGPIDVSVDVPDCVTAMTAAMTERTTGSLCDVCDKTFEGSITYSQDTCSDLLEQSAPSTGEWGFVFTSPTERTLYLSDGSGNWAASGDQTGADGTYGSSVSEEVNQVPPSCGLDVQYLGDVHVTVEFVDAP